MKIHKTAFFGFLLLVIGTPVMAAELVKLGFFDMQTIIDRSETGKEGAEQFRLEMEKTRQGLAAQLKELKEMDDEFKKKEHLLSQEIKKTRVQELIVKKREYERSRYEADRKLEEFQQGLLKPIRDKIFEIVSRIGKEEGYTMIWEMRRTGLVYAPDSLNLTDRIIRELNEIAATQDKKQ